MDDNTRTRIEAALSRNPQWEDGRIAKNVRGSNTPMVAAVRAGGGAVEHVIDGGIRLAGKTVRSRRPALTAATLIMQIPKGWGYPPEKLAAEWGLSVNTITSHAKNMKCLQFVEMEPYDWVTIVMHPETAVELFSKIDEWENKKP
jgi:hypothetical protein